jgi:hypothetical protein
MTFSWNYFEITFLIIAYALIGMVTLGHLG